jgi:hypothetical protein
MFPMIAFNVDMAMTDANYPGLRIAGEFSAVEQYLLLLSEYLPVVRDQTSLRSKADLKRKYPKHSRADFAENYEQIEWVSNTLVPKFFLGSFVLASWATFEVASAEIAAYVRKKEHARLRLTDLRGSDGWKKAQLYFDVDAHRIEALQVVRNLFAHANGSLSFERDSKRLADIRRLVKADIGVSLHEDDVLVSENFLRESFGSLKTAINVLLGEIEKRYKNN